MYWYLIALICLVVAVVLLIRCVVLRKKAARGEEPTKETPKSGETLTIIEGKSEKQPASSKKVKMSLAFGILFLLLTEAAILLGNHFAA